MKEYTSDIIITFSINNLEAENQFDYIEKLKEQFEELHGIELQDHEIKNIQEGEVQECT